LTLAAQSPPSPAPSAKITDAHLPALAQNGDEVSLDMVVRDKKGRPIFNLEPADVAATDAGKPVKLSDMRLIAAGSGDITSVTTVFDRMDSAASKGALDIVNQILAIAPKQCLFAVVDLNGRLQVLRNFTTVRDSIAAAAAEASDQAWQEPVPGPTDAEKEIASIVDTGATPDGVNATEDERARAHMLQSALEESRRLIQDQHASTALAGLLALVKTQQNLSGRRVIVFFSEGLPDQPDTLRMTAEIAQAADRAGVTIYTVKMIEDISELHRAQDAYANSQFLTAPSGGPATTQRAEEGLQLMNSKYGNLAFSHEMSGSDADSFNGRPDLLSMLAADTGGVSLSGWRDVHKPLANMVSEFANYYRAVYTPEPASLDGAFHPIDIKPRRAGIAVRARAGYFAVPPGETASSIVRPFEAPLLKALGDASSPSDLTFKQAVLQMGAVSKSTENEVVVEVPISALVAHEDAQTSLYSVHLAIVVQIKDKSGAMVDRFSQEIVRRSALDDLKAGRGEAITWQRRFTAAPGDYTLQTAVSDVLGTKVGVQRSSFSLSNPSSGPWLSDLVLVGHTEPAGGESDTLDPLRYAQVRVVPNLNGSLAAGIQRLSFYFSIRPDMALDGGAGKLDIDILRDGKTVAHTARDVALSAKSDGLRDLATFKSASFPPGNYQAALTFTQGEKSFSRSLTFSVDDNEAGANRSPADSGGTAIDSSSPHGASPESFDPAKLPAGEFTPAASSNLSPPPGKERQDELLNSAREGANSYREKLQNFRCIEITDRFIDSEGTGHWAQQDTITESVDYEDGKESRKPVGIKGLPANRPAADGEARMSGEFGGILDSIFNPTSKAEFQWKATDTLAGSTVEIFSYHVDVRNSVYELKVSESNFLMVGYHGLVYIDDATRSVRRVVEEAEGIRHDFPIQASVIAVDYDYVPINNHDYLMPVRGEMRVRLGRHKAVMHRVEFRDYHRFGSQVKIVGDSK
jgi:VWFA-related protein